MGTGEDYLTSVRKQFDYYKLLGERSIAQMSDGDLLWRSDDEANSVAIIVNHLWGNMMSRWTDFLTSDGEKEWRRREQEFEAEIKDRKELLRKWIEGWDCLNSALDGIDSSTLDELVYIRNEGHTIVEAVNRQLCHYSYHIGQIVFIGRMRLGTNWQSLSIPRGESRAFNVERFSKEKERKHFTDGEE